MAHEGKHAINATNVCTSLLSVTLSLFLLAFFRPWRIMSSLFPPGGLKLKRRDATFLVALVAFAGVVVQAAGGTWDGQAHLVREEPEQFWSLQHSIVYAGLAMVACSAAAGSAMLVRSWRHDDDEKALLKWVAVVSFGAILELFSGYFDMRAHEVSGLDAMVTPSHVGLHVGILIVSLGCYFMFSSIGNRMARKVVPMAIMTVFFSAAWVAFNLIMAVAPALLCLPIYKLLSSGCEVL